MTATKGKPALTMKEKQFCREYIYDWNATRSYLVAYPNTKNANTAGVLAHLLLRKDKISQYIAEIQSDLEKVAGISRLKVLNEHIKLGFSSIAHLHNTWITRKDFETLTDDQKDCIAEIDTKVRIEYESDPLDPKEKIPVSVEYVKIKLYDKQKALDSITKMMGYDPASKMEVTGKDGKPLTSSIQIEIINSANQVKKDDSGS